MEHAYNQKCSVLGTFSMHAQLVLWFPNTAGATRTSHVAPEVGANFTVKFK